MAYTGSTKERINKMKYTYFVSGSHDNGGLFNDYVNTEQPISTPETVKDIRDIVQDRFNISNVIISNWILLSIDGLPVAGIPLTESVDGIPTTKSNIGIPITGNPADAIEELHELINTMQTYSGYKNNGYDKMNDNEKKLYTTILKNNDHL